MAAQSDVSTYDRITKELYQKNLELVNTNKILELIREIYQIAINSSNTDEISQKFIEIIVSRLGFADGLVMVKDVDADFLRTSGITKTQLNQTIMDLAGVGEKDFSLPLDNTSNEIVGAFRKRTSKIVKGVVGIWEPLVKGTDLNEIQSLTTDVTYLVNPIIVGEKNLGVFAVSLLKNVKSLTDFEKSVLGRITTVFGVALDRVRVGEELKLSQEREISKAKELVRLKDEFVFIASHDLRTPVTAIRGFVDIIKNRKEAMSKQTADDFLEIESASQRLNQLINDLLEVARSESGAMKVASVPVNIAEIINNAVGIQTPEAEKNGIKVSVDLDEKTSMVLGDQAKLSEVVENLISNAIKYNKKDGSIKITSEMVPGGMAAFSFIDTGFGIPESQKDRVFQKFFRARQQGLEGVPGTGLGLFLVRMLIEKMDGEISFESREGWGSTFTFTLPLTSL